MAIMEWGYEVGIEQQRFEAAKAAIFLTNEMAQDVRN
jgi:hypothetical protein